MASERAPSAPSPKRGPPTGGDGGTAASRPPRAASGPHGSRLEDRSARPGRTATAWRARRASRPSFSRPIAALTHAVSGLSLSSDDAEVLARRRGAANWPTMIAVVELHARHVERGRQVDDEPVDLPVLEGRDRQRRWCRRPSAPWSGRSTSVIVSRLVVPTWAPNLHVLEVGDRRRLGELASSRARPATGSAS